MPLLPPSAQRLIKTHKRLQLLQPQLYARRFITAHMREWRDFRGWEFKRPCGTREEQVVKGYVTATHKDGPPSARFVWSCRMRERSRLQWEPMAPDIHEDAPAGTPEHLILRPR
jgi:hypothetical protein